MCWAEGRAESEAVTYCNLEYWEAQLCRIWAKRGLMLHHAPIHTHTHMHTWLFVSPEGTQLSLGRRVGRLGSRVCTLFADSNPRFDVLFTTKCPWILPPPINTIYRPLPQCCRSPPPWEGSSIARWSRGQLQVGSRGPGWAIWTPLCGGNLFRTEITRSWTENTLYVSNAPPPKRAMAQSLHRGEEKYYL